MLPGLDEVQPLPGPFELLDLRHGESATLSIVDGVLGRANINPTGAAGPKPVIVLRVFLEPGTKPTVPYQYDITSQHLASTLWEYIRAGTAKLNRFKITKYGEGKPARFSIEVQPR